MKRILIFALIALLILSACAERVKENVDADSRVQQFLTLFPEANYGETTYSGTEVAAIKDVVVADCGQVDLPESMVRAVYTTTAASLAAYVNTGTREVFCVASKLNQDAFAFTKGDPSTVENGTLVTVNGQSITLTDVQTAIARLPKEARAQATVPATVNTLIDQELLRQATEDIEIPDAEVDAAVAKGWAKLGYTDEASFVAALAEQGGSLDEYRTAVRGQLRLNKFLVDKGIAAVNVTEEEARQFYLDNTNAFIVSEQARFRQLFIGFNASGGREAASARLKNALQQIRQGLDFCAAVQRYSDDEDSKDRCGEYTTARGVLLPSLEAAIFALKVNQSTVTESANGFHVIVMMEKRPTQVVPYAQAQQQVVGLLQNQLMQQRLNLYLLKLRAEADIVDYTQ